MSANVLNFGVILTVLRIINGYENIALNKPTHQSQAYWSPYYAEGTFNSSNAVDGLKTDLSAFGGQCVISGDGYKTATWWVNLTSIYSIHDIRIYHRTGNVPWDSANGYTKYFLGFYVYVSNTTETLDGHLCFHDTIYTTSTIPAIIDIPCPVHGQFVIYYNERPQRSAHSKLYSKYAHNDICEVEVNGCNKTGYYGPTCSFPCPDTNCRYCHVETGACQGCKPGYKGHQCELQCGDGTYGQDCGQKCRACLGQQCHHINGSCPEGCDAGYEGTFCDKECSAGTFGNNCEQDCNENCGEPLKCNRTTGVCEGGCQPGWKGLQCTNECDGGFYGTDCNLQCGHCLESAQCHPLNGSCLNGCNAGYIGSLCNETCSQGWYGSECQEQCGYCKGYRPCHHVTGSCSGLCEPGYSGDTCKENVFSQLLDNQREMLELMRKFMSFKRRNAQLRESFTSPTDFM
ncbi:multiple epidermal growth factor-like domains protein 10 [Saccostrea echinata]|uniref:multiple epidermal growth factor-like domains protein 10 n=1 Tax=Saccostrea echinata TaxID=191078 RepID=UPI002A83607B|nr:multiple epidermal growth factor-like domains protein 10 [Saccostrea echinata]